jgi:hypothetical protein
MGFELKPGSGGQSSRNACHLFVDQLADLVFAGHPKEFVIEKATLMLRTILEAKPGDPKVVTDGFRAEILDYKQPEGGPARTAFAQIHFGGSYGVGERVGKAIGQALNGKMDRPTFRTTLRALLCE